MMKIFICGISTILALIVSLSLAAPEPAAVQKPGLWTVDVTFEHPQQISLRTAGEKKRKLYWYTIITLTNKTNRDVDFYPKCELMTDTFEVVPAGKGMPTAVFDHIKKRYQRKYPFLQPLENAGNKILQGQDNAKDIAIIWPDFDKKAKGVKIYIAGLSNEAVAIDHPTEKDKTGGHAKIYLRKTLELSYKLGGDAAYRSDAKPAYQGKRWVMR